MALKASFNGMRLGKMLDEPGVEGETYLTRCIKMGQHQALKEFLDLGCDPLKPNAHKQYPLYLALEMKDRDALNILLNKDENLAFMKKGGMSFKQHAIKAGLIDIARRCAGIERQREAYLTAISSRGW